MAEHLVKTLCHIVFILKLYSKFLLGLFHCPAYLQLAPLPEEHYSSGMLRTTNGQSVSWDSHPSEERSEPPIQRKDGSIIIPGICIVASSRTTRLL